MQHLRSLAAGADHGQHERHVAARPAIDDAGTAALGHGWPHAYRAAHALPQPAAGLDGARSSLLHLLHLLLGLAQLLAQGAHRAAQHGPHGATHQAADQPAAKRVLCTGVGADRPPVGHPKHAGGSFPSASHSPPPFSSPSLSRSSRLRCSPPLRCTRSSLLSSVGTIAPTALLTVDPTFLTRSAPSCAASDAISLQLLSELSRLLARQRTPGEAARRLEEGPDSRGGSAAAWRRLAVGARKPRAGVVITKRECTAVTGLSGRYSDAQRRWTRVPIVQSTRVSDAIECSECSVMQGSIWTGCRVVGWLAAFGLRDASSDAKSLWTLAHPLLMPRKLLPLSKGSTSSFDSAMDAFHIGIALAALR